MVDFKESMNLNLGKDQLELDGLMTGFMESSNDSLNISLNSKIDYLKYWNNEDVYFLINTEINSSLSNHLLNGYAENIECSY